MKFSSFAAAATSSVLFAGCVSIGPLQETVGRFAQAAHSTSTAEIAFLRSVQKIDEEAQFYQSTFRFANAKTSDVHFDVIAKYSPTVLTEKEVGLRQTLMSALVLYADKMGTIACGDDDKKLDQNSQGVAKSLLGLATAGKMPAQEIGMIYPVQTAVAAIARFALDDVRAKDLKRAATDIHPQLEIVVKALQDENTSLSQSVTANLGQIELELRAMIAMSHSRPETDPAAVFFQIVESRRLMADTSQLIGTSLDASATGKENFAQPVNEALNSILNGNTAIAHAGIGGLSAAAADLSQRATAAKDFYDALTKK